MSNLLDKAIDKVKHRVEQDCKNGTVGTSERILSVVAGGFILGAGIKFIFRKPLTAISGLSLGGALVYRGVTGRCAIKEKLEEEQTVDNEVTVIERRYVVK